MGKPTRPTDDAASPKWARYSDGLEEGRTAENADWAKFAEYPFHAVSILEDGCGRRLGGAA
jgi:hypothetical protein